MFKELELRAGAVVEGAAHDFREDNDMVRSRFWRSHSASRTGTRVAGYSGAEGRAERGCSLGLRSSVENLTQM